jgi:hypothetical protein
MIKSGSVDVDADAVEDISERLAIDAKALRDRLLHKARAALRDGAASLRRQKLSARRDLEKARKIASRAAMATIEKALSDASREWRLAVDVAVQGAMEEGRSQAIVKSFGRAAAVWKKVHPDCCRWCRALYTVDGTVPRVFTIEELARNGSNVGRRAGRPLLKGEGSTEWLPTIGPAHVLCKCELQVLPPGMAFNARGVPVRAAKRAGGGRRT